MTGRSSIRPRSATRPASSSDATGPCTARSSRRREHDWEVARASGLLDRLVADGLLVDHDEAPFEAAAAPDAVAVIRPRLLDFVSYPYEWSFGQLKEAALLTLELQSRALDAGMRLKDASAYNIQFDAGRPILIDTLSFEAAPDTEPWPAYRQFCEHFLAPLALIAHRDARCGLMLREFIDGIPLDLAATLLPGRTQAQPRPPLAPPPPRRRAAPRRVRGRRRGEHGPARAARQLDRPARAARLPATNGGGAALGALRPLGRLRDRDLLLGGGDRQQGPARARDARPRSAVGARGTWGQRGRVQRDGRRGRLPVIAWDQDAGERRGPLAQGARGRQPRDPAAHPRPGQPVAGDRLEPRRARAPSSSAASRTSSWRSPWCTTSPSATTCRSPALRPSSPGWPRAPSSSSCRRRTR